MILESARPRLAQISDVAARLNDASDRFTQELKAIETELNALNLGVAVELDDALTPLPIENRWNRNEGRSERFEVFERLGYGRFQDRWCLLVTSYERRLEGPDQMIGTTGKTPLLSASRETRIAAAEQILELLGKLEAEAEEKIASLAKVMDARTKPDTATPPATETLSRPKTTR